MSEIIQVNVPNFFLFCRNPKNDKVWAEKRFWDLNIKINPYGSHPTQNPLFFKIQTSHGDSLLHIKNFLK